MTPPMRSLIKHPVLIVDDHPIVRRGLKEVINEAADLEVCGEAASVPEALRQVEATQPHVVIVDITLGDEDGIELIDYIKLRWPSMKILVSSAHDEETFAGRVLRAGALGFISKREPLAQVVEAVRHVLRGEVYLSPHMATCLLQLAARRQILGPRSGASPVEPGTPGVRDDRRRAEHTGNCATGLGSARRRWNRIARSSRRS